MSRVAVIGAGVSGLSSAVNLQKAGFDVTILTRELPLQTTSKAAGAVWYGNGMTGKMREWAAVSLRHFLQLAHEPESGIQIRRVIEVSPYPVHDPWFKHDIPHFSHLSGGELPAGAKFGFAMDVPIIEPPKYLQILYNQFLENGGTIEEREIHTVDDLVDDYPLIVNCSGVGARQVANDPQVYPIRGQTVVVSVPEITQAYMDDYTFTYIFPRTDGVLIGGIAQPNNWSMDVDPAITEDIFTRCSAVDDRLKNAPIVHQFVGLRPGRGAVRLEPQRLSKDRLCIHNYGHAGVGFTLSWGCATEVTQIAQELI